MYRTMVGGTLTWDSGLNRGSLRDSGGGGMVVGMVREDG